MTDDVFTITEPAKLERVERLIQQFPDWWQACVFDCSFDMLAKMGWDPHDVKYSALPVAYFIRELELLDPGDPQINPICNHLGPKLHASFDLRGFDADIIQQAQQRVEQRMWQDFDDRHGYDRED